MATGTEARQTLSVHEAAKRLGIGVRAAYRAIHENRLPHLRFGKRIVVPICAIEAMERDAYQSDPNASGREDAAG